MPGSSEQMVVLVCSVCGSANWTDTQRSVDDRWVVARCRDHKDRRQAWTPLISERAYQAKRKAPRQAEPSDIFGPLSDGERAALTRPVKLL